MFRIPLPNFSFRRPPPMRMMATFSYGMLPQYNDYLDRNPSDLGSYPIRLILHSQEKKVMRAAFDEARAQYKEDVGRDHWDNTLPGDCENQCLWFRRTISQQLCEPEFGDACRLVLCKTEKGEGHLMICFREWVMPSKSGQARRAYDSLIDFRLVGGFMLPVGHKAFDGYKFIAMQVPGARRWRTVSRVPQKEEEA